MEVKRVLYGANRGAPVQKLSLHQDVTSAAAAADFDVQAYKFRARQEQNRKPRHVKIGLIQNSIKAPTTAPYAEQTQVALHALICFVSLHSCSTYHLLKFQVYGYVKLMQPLMLSMATCHAGSLHSSTETGGCSWQCRCASPVPAGSMDDAICILYQRKGMARVC